MYNNWKLFFIFLYFGYLLILINFIIYLRLSIKSYKGIKIKDDFIYLFIFRFTSCILNEIIYCPFLGKIII